ncbi:hypothetical protein [Geosporobacter ferrireducens]|uniref:Uncharacterized protein n=1 Tax=Geosporobacter ferrireducens TaxID=1424294 RepID=A0A1D8GIL8_9FIRM|nr:hypothetical protein [Geosporobacter ferrireducens]AOT70728.1 hypothetical protein Gferi_14770 [Geosporobacter ferrireducens]
MEKLLKNGMQPSVGMLLRENVLACAWRGYLEEKHIDLVSELIGSSVHGKLLFFIQGRSMDGLEAMITSIRREIEFLMKGKEV